MNRRGLLGSLMGISVAPAAAMLPCYGVTEIAAHGRSLTKDDCRVLAEEMAAEVKSKGWAWVIDNWTNEFFDGIKHRVMRRDDTITVEWNGLECKVKVV